MLFEQSYGRFLVDKLNCRIQDINKNLICKLYDEAGYKPLYNEPDVVAVVISGGNASRSQVMGQDQNVLPLTVTIMCKEKYSDDVRDAIDGFQKDYNAVPLIIDERGGNTDGGSITNFKAIYTTPIVLNHGDYATKTETIKAAFISFSASVIYGQTAVIKLNKAILVIAEGVSKKEYEIKHIADFNSSSMPSYEAYLPHNQERLKQADLSRSNAFSYTLYKVPGDELQEVLDEELLCKDGLYGKTLSIKFYDGETLKADIKLTTYQLHYSFVNNTAAYSLTLGV